MAQQSGQEHSESDSETCDEISGPEASYMPRTLRKTEYPKAFSKRSSRVRTGDIAAILVAPNSDEATHPFHLVKVHRLSKKSITVHYYGDAKGQFLGVYQPLVKKIHGRAVGRLGWKNSVVQS